VGATSLDLGRFAEPALLILISLADHPRHGYAMMEVTPPTPAPPRPGTLYGSIARLARSAASSPPVPSGDRRQPFRITDPARRHADHIEGMTHPPWSPPKAPAHQPNGATRNEASCCSTHPPPAARPLRSPSSGDAEDPRSPHSRRSHRPRAFDARQRARSDAGRGARRSDPAAARARRLSARSSFVHLRSSSR